MNSRSFLVLLFILPILIKTECRITHSKASLEQLISSDVPSGNALSEAALKIPIPINSMAVSTSSPWASSSSTSSSASPLNSTITTTRPVKALKYPFVASLQINRNGMTWHLCGAAILDAHFVITAAHCFLKYPELSAKNYFVSAGFSRLFDMSAKQFRVSQFKKHPDFKPLKGHDIALLKLATPIPIDQTRFASIDFHDTTRKAGGVNALLLGWGRTKPNTPKNLETVAFRTIEDEVCFQEHRFKFLTDSEICAVNTKGPRGACDGDSGAPLVDVRNHSLYGLLSYARNPCEAKKSYAFTRISTHVHWIEQQMRAMQKGKAKASKKRSH